MKKTEEKKIKKEEKQKESASTVELELTEIEAINLKLKEAEEKVLRTNAEMINYRRRKDDEMAKKLKYSNEDFVLELLPIVDNLERAIKMDDDILDDEVSKFLAGIKMIYASLLSLFERYEIKEIKADKEVFDPNYHDAVIVDCNDKYDDDIVLEVYQKGYIFIDKVIRPAKVKVNKKGEMKDE